MRRLTKTVVPEIAELKLELRYVIGIEKLAIYSFNHSRLINYTH